MSYPYFALIEDHDEDGWQVAFPDVPEVILDAPTRAAAVAGAVDALGLVLLSYLADGQPLPKAEATSGVPIEPSVADSMKIALLTSFKASSMSKTELARRMGKSEVEARRVLDPYKPSTLPALEAALAALGLRARVEVLEAA